MSKHSKTLAALKASPYCVKVTEQTRSAAWLLPAKSLAAAKLALGRK